MDILISCLIAGIPLAFFEVLARTLTVAGDTIRKSAHVLSSVSVIIVADIYGHSMLIPVSVIFFVIMLLTRRIQLWHSLYKIDRYSYGEVTFALGVGCAALLIDSHAQFVFAVLVLGISDTAAYLIGTRYGHTRVPRTQKTVEGSFAFLVVTLGLGAYFLGSAFSPLQIVGISLLAAVIELISSKGLDNVFIPVSIAIVFSLMQ